MTVLDTLNFVAFNPLQNNNPIAVRRRKLMAKIDEQIQLSTNPLFKLAQKIYTLFHLKIKGCTQVVFGGGTQFSSYSKFFTKL